MRNVSNEVTKLVEILNDNAASNGRVVREVAILYASAYVKCESTNVGALIVREITKQARETMGKDVWRSKRSNAVSMVVKVLTLSGIHVASSWATGDFATFTVRACYDRLDRFNNKGELKPKITQSEKIAKYLRNALRKYRDDTLRAIDVVMSGSNEDENENDNVIGSINPFAEVGETQQEKIIKLPHSSEKVA
jgi:hypothetical protein